MHRLRRYINDKANLIRVMSLLRHNNPSIQFEAFNVFKVFVANPQKPVEIVDILANPISKPKLLEFLMVRVSCCLRVLLLYLPCLWLRRCSPSAWVAPSSFARQ